MARYTPLFYRGAPASIPQVVAHIQRTLTEEDPDYTPLRQRMPPASIPEIVAHIQEYLTENQFVTMEDIGNSIEQYIEAHPEIVGVFTVNGATGNVALDASDIPIETGEDPTVAGAISYLSSQLALLVADAVLSVNGVTPDDSHNVTLTGADITQDANTTKKLSETFGPATSSTAGSKGLVPAPAAGDENKILSGSGAWVDQPTGAVQTVCNVGPNAQGNVPLLGSNIPLQSMSLQTVAQAIAAVDGKTGSNIPTSTTDNTPISTSLSNLNDQNVNLQGGLAYIENGDVATVKSYTEGELLFWKGLLYYVNSGGIPLNDPIAGHVTLGSSNGGRLNAFRNQLLTSQWIYVDKVNIGSFGFIVFKKNVLSKLAVATFHGNDVPATIGDTTFQLPSGLGTPAENVIIGLYSANLALLEIGPSLSFVRFSAADTWSAGSMLIPLQ